MPKLHCGSERASVGMMERGPRSSQALIGLLLLLEQHLRRFERSKTQWAAPHPNPHLTGPGALMRFFVSAARTLPLTGTARGHGCVSRGRESFSGLWMARRNSPCTSLYKCLVQTTLDVWI